MKKANPLNVYGHHAVFAIALVITLSLIIWWIIFFFQSLEDHRQSSLDKIRLEARFIALELMTSHSFEGRPGTINNYPDYQVVNSEKQNSPFAVALAPKFAGLAVQPRKEILDHITSETKRKKNMILFESLFVVLFLLGTIFFLYKYVRLFQRTSSEVQEFFKGITHEIKTPITGIKAFLESLKSRSVQEEEMDSYVDLALQQVNRQIQLTDNILASSIFQLTRRDRESNLEIVGIYDFIKSYLSKKPDIPSEAAPILNKTGFSHQVYCNQNSLTIILDNLLNNAVKYGNKTAVDLKIELHQKGRYVEVQVIDRGFKIEEKFADKIFSAYKYLPSQLPQEKKGTGIGLYTSRKLARLMGGDLQLLLYPEEPVNRFSITLKRVDRE